MSWRRQSFSEGLLALLEEASYIMCTFVVDLFRYTTAWCSGQNKDFRMCGQMAMHNHFIFKFRAETEFVPLCCSSLLGNCGAKQLYGHYSRGLI